jgi:hypothetical protein
METHCQNAPEAAVIKEQGQSNGPSETLIQGLQASFSEVAIPQWCPSILIFKITQPFYFTFSKF